MLYLPCRGSISLQESSASHGSLHVAAARNMLVWNLGPRFPARQAEVNMSAILSLGPNKAESLAPSTIEEEFCTGQNAFAQVFP